MKHTATVLLIFFSFTHLYSDYDIKNSIVKIFTVSNTHDFHRPWIINDQQSSTGSGSIIEGKQIITNAHVVSNGSFIQVRRSGKAKKYIAEVKAISHELDIAVLTVKDVSFFDSTQALTFGELPNKPRYL